MKFKNIKCQDINDSSFKTVNFFNDEFTNHLDTQIGIDAIEPFEALNYEVKFIEHKESGRSFLSQKGFLKNKTVGQSIVQLRCSEFTNKLQSHYNTKWMLWNGRQFWI